MQQVVFFHFDPQHDLDRDFMKIAGDHRVGIVTKEPRDKVKALLKERNIDDLVEFIVSDSDAWHEDAAKEAGVAANEIIYVNSDRAGLARAEMYGIRGVVDPLGVTFALTQAAPDISGLAACTTDAQTAARSTTIADRMTRRISIGFCNASTRRNCACRLFM